jgi:thymidylate synthase
MKNNIQISIILIAIVSFTAFLVINEKNNINHTCSDELVETVEGNIVLNDSIITLFDNKQQQQREERSKKSNDIDSLSQSLYNERLTIKSKDMTIEEKVVELERTLKRLDDKKILAEEQSRIAQEMKNTAEEERRKATASGELYKKTVHQLEMENSIITKEVDKLKEECLRLNKLLGNDYDINKIDSIINLPDSIKVNLNSKNKIKRRKQKK